MSRFALITLIMPGFDAKNQSFPELYIGGAKAFGLSARKVTKSNPAESFPTDVILMYTDGMDEFVETMQPWFDRVIKVDPIECRANPSGYSVKTLKLYETMMNRIPTKARCFDIKRPDGTPYDRIIFADIDVIFSQFPIDLYRIHTPAMWIDNTETKRHNRVDGVRHVKGCDDPYDQNRRCGTVIPAKKILAVMDGNLRTFVPGAVLFIFEPNASINCVDFIKYIASQDSPNGFGNPVIFSGHDDQSICGFFVRELKLNIAHIGNQHVTMDWKKERMFRVEGYVDEKGNIKEPIIYHMFGRYKLWYVDPKIAARLGLTDADIVEIKNYADYGVYEEFQ